MHFNPFRVGMPIENDLSFAVLDNGRQESQPDIVLEPIALPCGLVMKNRLVKVAMYEHLASFLGGPPNEYHMQLYSEWAKHGWGMVITGNVQISHDHLTLGRDIVLPKSHSTNESLQPFRNLSDAIHGLYLSNIKDKPTRNRSLAIMQLNHPGRQSSNFIGGRHLFHAPLAPSPIPLGSGSRMSLSAAMVNSLMFQTPKAMSELDIHTVIEGFIDGAILAYKTGFDGIQLHAAHGYLLSQFLSCKSNKRNDKFSYHNALQMIRHIIERIRQSTRHDFIICIKLNAADYVSPEMSGAESLSDAEKLALNHVLTISEWGMVDVIEISGGDYEKPDFMTAQNHYPNSLRQGFFARFSHQALKALNSQKSTQTNPPLILLTGGLRTPRLLCTALMSGHANLLGIGRGSVLCPDLPSILRERVKDPGRWDDVPFQEEPSLDIPWLLTYPPFSYMWNAIARVKLVGAGITMAWFIIAMRDIARSNVSGRLFAPDYNIGSLRSIILMWAWTNDVAHLKRCLIILVVLLSLAMVIFW